MDDTSEDELMDFSDDDSLDSSKVTDATYSVVSMDQITQKMNRMIQEVVSSTEVSNFKFCTVNIYGKNVIIIFLFNKFLLTAARIDCTHCT